MQHLIACCFLVGEVDRSNRISPLLFQLKLVVERYCLISEAIVEHVEDCGYTLLKEGSWPAMTLNSLFQVAGVDVSSLLGFPALLKP